MRLSRVVANLRASTSWILGRKGTVKRRALLMTLFVGAVSSLALLRVSEGRATRLAPAMFTGDTVVYYTSGVKYSSTGSGTTYIEQISLPMAPGRQFWMKAINGDGAGNDKVTSANSSRWNGLPTLADLHSGNNQALVLLSPAPTDTLKMVLVGPATSYASITIFSIPDPTFAIFGVYRTRFPGQEGGLVRPPLA